ALPGAAAVPRHRQVRTGPGADRVDGWLPRCPTHDAGDRPDPRRAVPLPRLLSGHALAHRGRVGRAVAAAVRRSAHAVFLPGRRYPALDIADALPRRELRCLDPLVAAFLSQGPTAARLPPLRASLQ